MNTIQIFQAFTPYILLIMSGWNAVLVYQIRESHRRIDSITTELQTHRLHVSETFVKREEHRAASQELKAEITKASDKIDSLRAEILAFIRSSKGVMQ